MLYKCHLKTINMYKKPTNIYLRAKREHISWVYSTCMCFILESLHIPLYLFHDAIWEVLHTRIINIIYMNIFHYGFNVSTLYWSLPRIVFDRILKHLRHTSVWISNSARLFIQNFIWKYFFIAIQFDNRPQNAGHLFRSQHIKLKSYSKCIAQH